MTVTLVTHDATFDPLSAADYRDIYTELRRLDMEPKDRISFDRFIAVIGSVYSKAQWAKYDAGEIQPTRKMRNDLRRLFGKDPLALTIAEATAQASPDAAVWRVGDGTPEHVIMVGATPVTLYVNGTVQAVAPESHVTEVTRPTRTRKRYMRLCVPETHAARLNHLKTGYGVSGLDVIEAGLRAYENAS